MTIFKVADTTFGLVLIIAASLVATACTGPESGNASLKQDLRKRLEQNGENVWCVHDEYLLCTDVSVQLCKEQNTAFKADCINQGFGAVEAVKHGQDVGAVSVEFMTCMRTSHVNLVATPGDRTRMLSCAEDVELEPALMSEHLFGITE